MTISTYEHRTNQNNVSTEPPNVTNSYAQATQASIPRKNSASNLPIGPTLAPKMTQSTNRNHRLLLTKSTIPGKEPSKLTIDEVSEIKNNIEKSLSTENIDFEITKMRPQNNGGLLIELPTEKDKQQALTKLR